MYMMTAKRRKDLKNIYQSLNSFCLALLQPRERETRFLYFSHEKIRRRLNMNKNTQKSIIPLIYLHHQLSHSSSVICAS